MVTKKSKNPSQLIKKQNLIELLAALMIVILFNVISSFLFTRFDLTSEKRFTISPATKSFVHNLKDVVYVKVYLEGDFPAGFKRLRNATKEMLDEFRAYSNGNIEYEFIDPSASSDQTERNKLYQQLAEKGLQPTNLQEKGQGASSQKIIFPGAILTYRSQQVSLQLLKSQIGVGPEEMLNNSIQNLEYNLGNAIKQLVTEKRAKIGFLQGHKELNKMQVADMAKTLSESYDIDSVIIGGRLDALKGFNALIIAKPDSAFDEKDKFIIDQFIMKGGKAIWLIDRMYASMDSLRNKEGSSVAFANNLNIDDQLFKYGVRVNQDLVEDLQAAPIPIVTGYIGNQPQQKLLPWNFFPLVIPESHHPIVNNLNAIKFEFASSIDTIGVKGIKKTVLLTSSVYSKILLSPVRLSLGMLKLEPNPAQFNKPNRPLAVLLEGEFQSVYAHRLPPLLAENKEIDFRPSSAKNKMIVVSDGDIIRNDIKKNTGMVYPLGYDRATRETYGNKSFLLNCIDYLLDDSGLIAVRSKELKLRLLDHNKIEKQKFQWQFLNTVMPILLVLIFGIVRNQRRKKRYTQ